MPLRYGGTRRVSKDLGGTSVPGFFKREADMASGRDGGRSAVGKNLELEKRHTLNGQFRPKKVLPMRAI